MLVSRSNCRGATRLLVGIGQSTGSRLDAYPPPLYNAGSKAFRLQHVEGKSSVALNVATCWKYSSFVPYYLLFLPRVCLYNAAYYFVKVVCAGGSVLRACQNSWCTTSCGCKRWGAGLFGSLMTLHPNNKTAGTTLGSVLCTCRI